MNRKIGGYVLLAVGLVVAVVGLVGDALWNKATEGFGPQQIIVIVVGFLLAVSGYFLMTYRRKAKK
jgi:hypothetical protein